MTNDIREYFKIYISHDPRFARRTGTQLARGGVCDMDTLCRLLEREPEKLLSIRDIGPKSMALIQSVYKVYHTDGGGASPAVKERL